MAAADPDHFEFKVVFGSAEEVAAEIPEVDSPP